MGLLVDGKWVDQWYETESNQGEFKRQESLFRHWITPDGSAGPTGNGGFEAEAGRYHLYGLDYLHRIYTRVEPTVTSRVTVPVLWDKQRQTIVSNESAEIIRMLNSAFNEITGNSADYYPADIRTEGRYPLGDAGTNKRFIARFPALA